MTNEQIQQIWQEFWGTIEDQKLRAELLSKLVAHYYPLVKIVANKMHQRLSEVQTDELQSMGVDGLYDAIKKYDPLRKIKFETYAMHRIRGSMLDAIREADWIPRLVRSKATEIEKKRQIIESFEGRKLSDQELAKHMRMSCEEFQELAKGGSAPLMHSVNETRQDDGSGKEGGYEQIEDDGTRQPLEKIIRREMFSKLMGTNFTPQERKIVWLYYFEDRTMKEISDAVGLSESRVSQMHGMILKRLKKKIDLNPDYFGDILNELSRYRGLVPSYS